MVAVQGEDRKHYLSCRGVLQQFKKGNNRGQNEEFNQSGSDSRQFLRLYTTQINLFLMNHHSLY